MQPLIGIWWDNGQQIVALSHHPDLNATGRALIDSNLGHAESWTKVCHDIGRSPSDDYFCVPRGRVLFDTTRNRGLIYHGRSTPVERLSEVARAFQLSEWDGRIDDHYATGDDIDLLFDDD